MSDSGVHVYGLIFDVDGVIADTEVVDSLCEVEVVTFERLARTL